MSNILIRLQDALIEATKPSRDSTEAGGFVVMLTPDDPMVWINYAVPISSEVDVDEMVAVFRAADRTPRLEFFIDLWPGVGPGLEAKGFRCEKRMPIMVLSKENWRGLEHNHDVRCVDAANYHETNWAVRSAFGATDEIETSDPNDDPSFQRIADGSTLLSAAYIDGKVVGGGFGVGTKTVREIAGIGTLADYRKRGIASAVIAHLLDQFFGDGGEIAWLTPGDDTAQSVYSNLGFVSIAEQVVYEMS